MLEFKGMLTIGRLAARAGVTTDTLRYYEQEGLVAPADKSAGGYRLFGTDSIQRLRFIKHAQACGFTLAEIRELLVLRSEDAACCGDVRTRAIEKKLRLEAKIRLMTAMSKALDHLISDCSAAADPIDQCPILAALERGIAELSSGER